jgi:hypothetical protein
VIVKALIVVTPDNAHDGGKKIIYGNVYVQAIDKVMVQLEEHD